MATRRGRPPKNPAVQVTLLPQRTREHIIADLSVFHFQRIACKAGFVTQIPTYDYGYDLTLFTYTDSGARETDSVYVQLKATDSVDVLRSADGESLSFPVETRHLNLWQNEAMPVILVVFDTQSETAYWLYVQRYLRDHPATLRAGQKRVSVRLSMRDILSEDAMRKFRGFKREVTRRLRGTDLHG